MPLHPTVYAKLLGEKMEKHNTKAYLVNTGWSGGPYGVGERMKIHVTRACVNAILDGTYRLLIKFLGRTQLGSSSKLLFLLLFQVRLKNVSSRQSLSSACLFRNHFLEWTVPC